MTCIVGWLEDDKLCFCGDSAGVDENFNMVTRTDEKVFRTGDFLFGFTSSFRMGQLLRFSFCPPPKPEGKLDYAYMCTEFIEAVRDCLKRGGYTTVLNNSEIGGTFMVGFNKKIYTIENDFQVGMVDHPFWSVGCGSSYALGACYAMENLKRKVPLEQKITMAMYAAAEFSAGVRGPFSCVGIDYKKEKKLREKQKAKEEGSS